MNLHRRHCLALGLAAPAAARAFDLNLPRLEDLRPRWEQLRMGCTPEDAVLRLGEPNSRTETETLGVLALTLGWRDLSRHYSARFVAGRLVSKTVSDQDRTL